MMRQYELTERVLSYDPKADEALLNRAYVYAMKKHGDQKRRNGDPYFSHPLEVAAILTGLKLDDATIATALPGITSVPSSWGMSTSTRCAGCWTRGCRATRIVYRMCRC
jgi:hypothetical protein